MENRPGVQIFIHAIDQIVNGGSSVFGNLIHRVTDDAVRGMYRRFFITGIGECNLRLLIVHRLRDLP